MGRKLSSKEKANRTGIFSSSAHSSTQACCSSFQKLQLAEVMSERRGNQKRPSSSDWRKSSVPAPKTMPEPSVSSGSKSARLSARSKVGSPSGDSFPGRSEMMVSSLLPMISPKVNPVALLPITNSGYPETDSPAGVIERVPSGGRFSIDSRSRVRKRLTSSSRWSSSRIPAAVSPACQRIERTAVEMIPRMVMATTISKSEKAAHRRREWRAGFMIPIYK